MSYLLLCLVWITDLNSNTTFCKQTIYKITQTYHNNKQQTKVKLAIWEGQCITTRNVRKHKYHWQGRIFWSFPIWNRPPVMMCYNKALFEKLSRCYMEWVCLHDCVSVPLCYARPTDNYPFLGIYSLWHLHFLSYSRKTPCEIE